MLALTENVCVLIGYKGLEPFQFCIHLFIYLCWSFLLHHLRANLD